MHDLTAPAEMFDAIFGEIASIGTQSGDGVTRLAATAEDGRARDAFARWMRQAGAQVAHDAIGNQFACFDWAGEGAPWIFAGSHLDTQPRGGKFDGVLGVLSAGVAAVTLRRDLTGGRFKPTRNLAVVNWTNEEGARFQPSLTGSSVFSGTQPLNQALALQDGDGTPLADALAAIGVTGTHGTLPPTPEAYLELHVEQGRTLSETGRRIGIVEATWAACKMTVRWIGRTAHTGPTPMNDRRDALLAAARGIAAFEAAIAAAHPLLHRSAARLIVEPNSPNVVVDRATVWFELRGPDVRELDMAGKLALSVFEKAAADTGARLEIVANTSREPAIMNADMMAIVGRIVQSCGFDPMTMRSVSGHDAVALQNSGIPSALIFIPSVDGIAHHPDEWTEPEDVQAGLTVLTAALRHFSEKGYG